MILASVFTSRCFITEILDPKLYQVAIHANPVAS